MSDAAHVTSHTPLQHAAPRPNHRRNPFRLAIASMGALLVLAGAGLVIAPAVQSAGPRTLTVTPSTGLANEVVEVTWSGFTPTTGSGQYSVLIYQCTENPQSLDDCFTDAPFPELPEGSRQIARTAGDGTGRSVFEVRPAANLPRLGCSETRPCSILAFENDGVPTPDGQLHPTAVVAPLAFARSQADCPPVSNFDIRLDGASSSAPAFYRWAAQLCSASTPLVVDYTETSSTTGRENFLENLVDIGVSSEPVRAEELAEHPDRGEFVYAPVNLTAVTVAFNFRDPFTGEPLRDVVLSPRLVARLITDTNIAGFFGDPELRALNPTVRFPSVTMSAPALRAERNAATRLITSWMANDAEAQRFIAGNDIYGVAVNPAYKDYPYPRDLFENVAQSSQFLPRAGQRNVALRMFYGVRPAGSTQENPAEIGFIGVVDLPTAQRFGLSTAKLINPAGEAVAPTEESILAGFATMTRTPEGVATIADAAVDPEAYPLVKVDYALVPKAFTPATRATAAAGLLEHVVGPGQDSLPAGYVPLPDELRAETTAVATALRTPPTTGTPPPAQVSGGGFDAGLGSGVFTGTPSRSSASRGSATAPAADTGGEVAAATPTAATAPALPALATTSDSVLLPVLLIIAGIAFVGWGLGEVRPAAAKAGAATRSLTEWVRSQLRAGGGA